jgi:DNA-binding MarR family transcriptional regulator
MKETTAAAQLIVHVIPLVMRAIGSRLRHKADMPSPAHFGILFMLSNENMNLSELARQHSVSLPTMSNSVSTLVQHGLVARRRAAHDRRQVVIEVTDSGREMLQSVLSEVVAYVDEVLASLSLQELDQLQKGLSVLRSAFLTSGG